MILALLPLPEESPPVIARFFRWLVVTAQDYHQVRVISEGGSLGKGPFLVGLEPHSSIPTGIPVIFNPYSNKLPKELQPCHGGATSAMFVLPLLRQFMWFLGIRSVTKAEINRLLAQGRSVCLNPGGIQECLVMEKGKEVAFLRKRLGFVRLAIQNGVPLVPAFVFGQSGTFHWWRPGPPFIPASWLEAVSRRVGFVPMALWGLYGTLCPYDSPMTVVLGKPIVVPKDDSPSKELCQKFLDQFIAAMIEMVEKRKSELGFPDMRFEVY